MTWSWAVFIAFCIAVLVVLHRMGKKRPGRKSRLSDNAEDGVRQRAQDRLDESMWALPDKKTIVITYMDSSGDLSERTVDVTHAGQTPHGGHYIKGFCHLRREDRTFKLERIKYAQNLSGELIPRLWEWLGCGVPETDACINDAEIDEGDLWLAKIEDDDQKLQALSNAYDFNFLVNQGGPEKCVVTVQATAGNKAFIIESENLDSDDNPLVRAIYLHYERRLVCEHPPHLTSMRTGMREIARHLGLQNKTKESLDKLALLLKTRRGR